MDVLGAKNLSLQSLTSLHGKTNIKHTFIAVGSVGLDKDFIKLYQGDHEAKIADFDKLLKCLKMIILT
ncbi:MAG: hypothetical protein CM15mP127_12020 [Gammaproteobacteria bacterium]|nr:MAG: hypothetical protein CM15mP127_12020 [Gammaproteobacteria bacterium]